jgi:hypothetical protein
MAIKEAVIDAVDKMSETTQDNSGDLELVKAIRTNGASGSWRTRFSSVDPQGIFKHGSFSQNGKTMLTLSPNYNRLHRISSSLLSGLFTKKDQETHAFQFSLNQ